ncbi:MAG: LysR family nitrogen assimilation transcriptional regulator [Paracoccaceae bacterium]|jgi:LysR family nitrogen assimilation transcriptional regulator
MDLRQLQYFTRIAESGSFREAAARANIAQSALSRHMRALEEELGVILMERHARGIRLTAEGEKLKRRADNILRDVEETKAELTATTSSPHGTVTIGASSTTSRLLYARLAEATNDRFPGIDLQMTEGVSYFLLEGMDTGRIDLAIMVDPEVGDYLSTESLVTEKVYLVGSPRYSDMPTAPCSAKDLVNKPMVLFARPSGGRAMLENAAAAHNVPIHVRFEAGSPDVIKDFVLRGLGYAMMPYSSIFKEVERGELVVSEFDGFQLTRKFIRRTDRPSTPAADAIAELIREEFRALAKEGAFGL